jgi:hypothetical protein
MKPITLQYGNLEEHKLKIKVSLSFQFNTSAQINKESGGNLKIIKNIFIT